MATLPRLLAFMGFIAAVWCNTCFDDLGCFDSPHDCHRMTPSNPADIGTTFQVFTRDNPKIGDVLDRKNLDTIRGSRFSPSRETKIFVHGWKDSMQWGSWEKFRDRFLDTYDVNVIYVDWSKGSGMGYLKSTANTRVVGREIAKLIEAFNAATGATFDSMHIIGHSLGAHTAGYAGEACQDPTSNKGEAVGRITGLDPAGPEFSGNLDNACRLDRSDAPFVDIMHTDGEVVGGAGLMDQISTLMAARTCPDVRWSLRCVIITESRHSSWRASRHHVRSPQRRRERRGRTSKPDERRDARLRHALIWATRRTSTRGKGHSIWRPTQRVLTARGKGG
ncbi:pancreatic lipase-related protein 2 isoform X2 [Strongylocentrotus purpuratus]|uniref:Lipase domain-containing protein n=1 Tax=Strongylocentrotus purpuratus TaxID=7668 RepID=A0A7M7NVM1_STRPU|nr:pancreatic lipase-related protein 2 isoform X2 [Strongylocentrotus purpuratus]